MLPICPQKAHVIDPIALSRFLGLLQAIFSHLRAFTLILGHLSAIFEHLGLFWSHLTLILSSLYRYRGVIDTNSYDTDEIQIPILIRQRFQYR